VNSKLTTQSNVDVASALKQSMDIHVLIMHCFIGYRTSLPLRDIPLATTIKR